MSIIEWLSQPWPWYVAGPLIALVMFLLLWVGGNFGVSSTLRTMCSMGGASRYANFFDFDWRSQTWNLAFVIGAIIGGYLSSQFLTSPDSYAISSATIQDLESIGIGFSGQIAPQQLFSIDALDNLSTWIYLVVGGLLIGFGTRWAGGCTSGHAISGLSNLQLPSFIAVIGFFIGGLLMTHFIFPLIF